MTGTKREFQCTFLVISRPFLPRMRNVSDKSCRENQNTHFVFSNLFFFENRAVYEIMWENIVEPDRPQITMWHCQFRAGYLRLQTHTQNM